jgi:hypothetical protein
MWKVDELEVVIFDSALQMFKLPSALKGFHSITEREKSEADYVSLHQSPVLARKGHVSSWHMDPIVIGGGWMYILKGEKEWRFHDPYMSLFYYNTTDNDFSLNDMTTLEFINLMSEMPAEDLATIKALYPDFRFTPVQTATAREGDFVYFPPGWLHRVETIEKTFGVAGYVRPHSTIERQHHYEDFFHKLGINGTWNEEAVIDSEGKLKSN